MKFEEFIEEKFASMYGGLDDEMADSYNDWLVDQDPCTIIEWAEEWHNSHYVPIGGSK